MPRTLITICTYNEIENLPELVEEIFRYVPQVDILVIDDNSSDGTGAWVEERAATDPRVHGLHRAGKLGLGTATIAGFQYAIEQDYDYVLNLDADFSHPPENIPDLLAGMSSSAAPAVDVMIGSRYVRGGGITGWPLYRRVMSLCVNLYARAMLSLPMKDCSGSFRCYRIAVLRTIDLDAIRSTGYSYLEEILWHLKRQGARFGETPIIFSDRERGQSKINLREALAALVVIARLGVTNWLGI